MTDQQANLPPQEPAKTVPAWRAPRFTVDGRIDCEIEHEVFGWIMFTVDPTDTGSVFDVEQLDAEIRAAGGIAAYVAPAISDFEVDAERDRRVNAGFTFAGVHYDFDPASQGNITAMGALAGLAVLAGAQTGDLRWHGGATDFVWIASNNSFVPMDAATCLAFAKTAQAHKSRLIFAARALKSMSPIPSDFTSDGYW